MKTEEIPSPTSSDDLRIGEQLKLLRQKKSLTLNQVADETKISHANLQAIEIMAYDKLPADSFTRGQLVLYANFLGMDGRLAAERFFYERDGDRKPQFSTLQQSLHHQPLTPKKLAEPTHVSSATIAGMLLLLIVCSFTVFCLYFSWNPFAFLTDRVFNPSVSKTTLFHPADPATANGGPVNPFKLHAFFLKDSRVLVSIDHKAPVEKTHAKGTEVSWEAERQLHVEFFQPDSAELRLNGASVPFPNHVEGRFRVHLPLPAATP